MESRRWHRRRQQTGSTGWPCCCERLLAIIEPMYKGQASNAKKEGHVGFVLKIWSAVTRHVTRHRFRILARRRGGACKSRIRRLQKRRRVAATSRRTPNRLATIREVSRAWRILPLRVPPRRDAPRAATL